MLSSPQSGMAVPQGQILPSLGDVNPLIRSSSSSSIYTFIISLDLLVSHAILGVEQPYAMKRPYAFGLRPTAMLIGLACTLSHQGKAQSPSFAGNAQHTAIYPAPAKRLNQVRWSTPVDLQY